MKTATLCKIPTYGNEEFDRGVRYGVTWQQTGDEDLRQPTAQLIVDFIRDNVLEPAAEGLLDEEHVTNHAGFLTGWIIGQFL